MALGNKTGMTMDVDSITNSAVMALDAVFRRYRVPFAHRHDEARVVIHALVASVVADKAMPDYIRTVGLTTGIDDIVRHGVMALNKVFNRNAIAFEHRHVEAYSILRVLVVSVVADDMATRLVEGIRDIEVAA